MGTTSFQVNSGFNKKQYMDGVYSNNGKNQVLKSAIVSNVYYAAVKTTDERTGITHIWCGVAKCEIVNGEFYYKDMSEDSLPYYFDCPKSVFDLLSPTASENANTWRETVKRVIEKKEQVKKIKLDIGTVINFADHVKLKGEKLGQATIVAKQDKEWFFNSAISSFYMKASAIKKWIEQGTATVEGVTV